MTIFLAASLFSLYNVFFQPMLVDDAYIGFRVAKNFAIGNGLVFNPGFHVMTSTTSLYALINGIWWKVFGDKAITFILILNVLWQSLTTCFLFTFAYRSLSHTSNSANKYVAAVFAALFFAFSAAVALIATCGMETPFYTFFICLSFYFLFDDRRNMAVGISCIPFLIRPEGFLVEMVIMASILLTDRKVYIRHVCIIASIVLPYLTILYLYYGTVIPQSIPAKNLYNISRGAEIVDFLRTYFLSPKRVPLGVLFLTGLYYSIKINRKLLPFIAWGILYACLFTFVGSWWKWYRPPFYMVYSCVISLGICFWAEFLFSRYPQRRLLTWFTYAIPAIFVLLALTDETQKMKDGSEIYEGFLNGAREIAQVILANSSKNQNVMLEPLGFIGFFIRFKETLKIIRVFVHRRWYSA